MACVFVPPQFPLNGVESVFVAEPEPILAVVVNVPPVTAIGVVVFAQAVMLSTETTVGRGLTVITTVAGFALHIAPVD